MNLLERETVITFNEQEQFAEVFTYNPRMKRELAALAISRPDETKKIKTNGVGGETYTVPKKWVRYERTVFLPMNSGRNCRSEQGHCVETKS